MENKKELILIRINGVDRPGLTASITEILSQYEVDIMDIGQADIHRLPTWESISASTPFPTRNMTNG